MTTEVANFLIGFATVYAISVVWMVLLLRFVIKQQKDDSLTFAGALMLMFFPILNTFMSVVFTAAAIIDFVWDGLMFLVTRFGYKEGSFRRFIGKIIGYKL